MEAPAWSVDPRGPAWTVWTNPSWMPTFVVDDHRAAVVLPAITFEVTRGYPTAYYALSPTDPRFSLFYRACYRPTKWELLSGV